MAFINYNSVAKTGLAASGVSLKEQYIPLWLMSSTTAYNTYVAAGSGFLTKGTTSWNATGTNTKLHTLSPAWANNQKFVLEATFYASSSYTAYVALWDFTAGAIVSGTTINTTAYIPIVLRSSFVTLIPGHVYGVTAWASTGGTMAICRAHLVAINY